MKNLFRVTARSAQHPVASGLLTGAALLATCLAAPLPASAQVTVLAPPATRYESAPPPRAGYAWQQGYWGWQQGRYVWTQGQWISAPRGRPLPPPPAPVSNVMRLSADALFPFNRGNVTDILPGGRAQIRTIAAKLRGTPFGRVEVRGYTDRLGSSTYNLGLSQQRAEAVKMLLIQQGVPADRIIARGMGPQESLTQCTNNQSQDRLVACLQPDRRVEIVTFARTGERPLPPMAANPMYRQ
jgi:OOP family OmpA-OmpF porin